MIHKGRKDFRVKIRGYGVEIAEIEKALIEHPSIIDTVVIARARPSSEARLVAYLVAGGSPPTITELQKFLRQSLPNYMIPSTFVILDALPLGAGGKVDRSALPVPSDTRPELATPFIAPRTPVEKNLAEIWAALLSLDRVGIHDNFFDLGGHSLLATRVVSRVIDHFQLELPMRLLFESPTITEMAAVITENQAKRLSESDLNCILSDLESLSEKDAQLLLVDNHKASTGTKGSDGGF